MELDNLLEEIGFGESERSAFRSFFILRPVYYRSEQRVLFSLSGPSPLPFSSYRKLREGLSRKLGMEVSLKISSSGHFLAPSEVRKYLRELTSKPEFSSLQAAYIQEKDGADILVLPDDIYNADPVLASLVERLGDCGIAVTISHASELAGQRRERESRSAHPLAPRREKVPIPPGAKELHIAQITDEVKDITIQGEVFKQELRTSRKGLVIASYSIHEGYDGFTVTAFETDPGRQTRKSAGRMAFTGEFLASIQEGDFIRVKGNVQRSSFSGDLTMYADIIEKVDAPEKKRTDDAPRKRIELHAHTNKSEMDGVCECADLVMRAHDWGMDAVAITDHNVVQAYPDAQAVMIKKFEKKNPDDPFKVIFGIEMDVVDERARIVTNPTDQKLGGAVFCSFDLETSGLSSRYDDIIEIGAVKIQNGIEIDSFQTFIRPRKKLTAFTREFTGIRQQDVDGAPSFAQAYERIRDFMKGTILVAHNGSFDYGFLDAEMRRAGKGGLSLPMIDTLPLSRALIHDRSAYRLGIVAHRFHIEYDEESAHRADYDARVLGRVLPHLLGMIPGAESMRLRDLDDVQPADMYKKNHPYHMELLAKNQQGIKDIYDLVTLAHTKYLAGSAGNGGTIGSDGKEKSTASPEPRILRGEIEKRRQNVLIGAGCSNSEIFETACNRSQEELEQSMSFYDYIEIQPPANYSLLVDETSSFNEERLETVLKNIIQTAGKLGKPVVATGDCHYLDPEDKIIWDIYIYAKRIGGVRHPMYYQRAKRTSCPDQHFRTTQEMLDCFSFLDPRTAEKIVIDNTHAVADQIERLKPLFTDVHTPHIDGCEEQLRQIVYTNAKNIYGDPLPEIVSARLEKELNSVVNNGFAVQYYIAHCLVKQSQKAGYVVGSRGSVGSSFLATMAAITEVNPLVPHYICPKCRHSEFFEHGEYADGFDMPEKKCPVCGQPMRRDGHNIPFETFLGFYGEKVPDIDLNFSGDYQNKAQLQIKEIFGEDDVFAAGTIETVKFKTALGYVHAYLEERHLPPMTADSMMYLATRCQGVRRTTGQHPAGIVVCPKENQIHDFTPLQYPANNPSSLWKTTHFAIKDLHDTILKIDVLGHVDPTAMRLLKDMSGIDPIQVPANDPETLSLFTSTEALHIVDPSKPYPETTGAAGLPEFGTATSRGVLEIAKPRTFADLVTLEGLTHGTDVWANNAKDLIESGTCTLQTVIGCRDDIMTYLIQKGMDKKEAFDIMEQVRHGRGLREEWIPDMKEHGVPDWYIHSCLKIKYMFPKAHAVAYCMMAVRIAWYKVHQPACFYAVFFSIRVDTYEIETMVAGEDAILARMSGLRQKKAQGGKGALSVKENALFDCLEVAYEMYRRGYYFTNIDLQRSQADNFIVSSDDPHAIIPSFKSIDGLGSTVANSIVAARSEHPFTSRKDLSERTQLSQTHIAVMDRMGVLKDLQDTNQMTLF